MDCRNSQHSYHSSAYVIINTIIVPLFFYALGQFIEVRDDGDDAEEENHGECGAIVELLCILHTHQLHVVHFGDACGEDEGGGNLSPGPGVGGGGYSHVIIPA